MTKRLPLFTPVPLFMPILGLLSLTACADAANRPVSASSATAEDLGSSMRAPSYAVPASARAPRAPLSSFPAPLPVHEGHDAPLGSGVVNSVDAAGRKINIRHEPIPAIGWPGMTMDFPVAASANLGAVKPGDRIYFRLRKGQGDQYEILSVQPRRER